MAPGDGCAVEGKAAGLPIGTKVGRARAKLDSPDLLLALHARWLAALAASAGLSRRFAIIIVSDTNRRALGNVVAGHFGV